MAFEKVDLDKIRKGVRVTFVLFALISAALLAFTVQKKTLPALRSSNPLGLLLALFFWALYISFDTLRMKFLAVAMGRKLGFFRAMQVITSGIFLAAVTPFQVSGLPLQIFILNRSGLSVGEATALLISRGITQYFFILLLLPFAVRIIGESVGFLIRALAVYIALLLVAGIAFYLLAVWKPQVAVRIIPRRWKRAREKFLEEIVKLRESFFILLRGRRSLPIALAMLSSLLSLLFYLSMIPSLLFGLGLDPRPQLSMAIQVIFQATLLYTPTPGGAGIAEAAGAALYSLVCPKYLLGVFIILWRFFTIYITAFLGAYFFIKATREV